MHQPLFEHPEAQSKLKEFKDRNPFWQNMPRQLRRPLQEGVLEQGHRSELVGGAGVQDARGRRRPRGNEFEEYAQGQNRQVGIESWSGTLLRGHTEIGGTIRRGVMCGRSDQSIAIAYNSGAAMHSMNRHKSTPPQEMAEYSRNVPADSCHTH